MADHISDGVLQEYSLDKLAGLALAAVEEHLLICDQCRTWLDAIEPVSYVHFTEDGPIYSRATLLMEGKVMARHWGKELAVNKECGSVSTARKYLNEYFAKMFPEHKCDGRCGPTREHGGSGPLRTTVERERHTHGPAREV
jgi:hypothetical protein